MMWITLGLVLLLTSSETIESRNVSIILFDGLCQAEDLDIKRYISKLENEYNITSVCVKETTNIEQVLNDKSVDLFLGTMDSENDRKYKYFAEYLQRPYITPNGIDKHQDGEVILSLGASFKRISTGLGVVLTHFKWRKIYLITEEMSSFVQFGNEMFIELVQDGFQPTLAYIKNDSSHEDIDRLLGDITDEQKGIVLLTHASIRKRIIETASRKENFVERHSIFLLETNPYKKPNIEFFNDTFFENTSSAIFHTIFYLHPTFLSAEGHISKRSVHTISETDVQQRITRRKRSITDNEVSEINFFYDAIMAIDAVMSDKNFSDLGTLFHLLGNRTLSLYSGDIRTDKTNNLLFDFVLTDLDVENWGTERVQEITQQQDNTWEILGLKKVKWPNDMVLGPDECFYVDSCRQESHGMDALYILAIAIAVLFVAGIATAVIIAAWRKIIHRDMSKGQHKVVLTKDDLVFLSKRDVQKGSKLINGNSNLIDRPDLIKDSSGRTATNRSMVSLHEYADITDTARYNGDLVHVKELTVKNFEVKSKVVQVIKALRDIRHENVNLFIGFYDDQQSPAIITDFCSRGSLEDVLNNKDIKLDWDFKVSLLTDLIRGVRYIHNSSLRWHGNLKCRNCLVDSRWVLKVSDFGLPNLYGAMKHTPKFTDTDILCMAPEHLRDPVPGLKGSEKGDVYSISIIMQCIVLRSEPYSTSGLSPSEILQKLRHPPPLLRPSVSHGTAPPQYIQLMKVCWSENPDLRPSIEEIYQQFKTFTGGKKMNIVDTMFRMLEKYSTDLEDLVKDRTLQLEEEKKKTELLLYRMLPRVVADSLKCGRTVAAEQFSEITIYFSDIVGFTTISANSTPMQVVDLLNDLYTMFDATIDAYDVYKVETIGDAYMVCSGLPVRNGNRHAGEISTMALDLLSQCGNFTIKHMPEVPLRVRIGLHSGPAVAGVVGLTMPRYCLFGDTVNTASRMESTGAAYRIHISDAVKIILENLGGYQTECRGEVELKGKGMAKTYWLIGKDGFRKELPDPPPLMQISLDAFKGGPAKRVSVRRTSSNSPMFRHSKNDQHDDINLSKAAGRQKKKSLIHVSPRQDTKNKNTLNTNRGKTTDVPKLGSGKSDKVNLENKSQIADNKQCDRSIEEIGNNCHSSAKAGSSSPEVKNDNVHSHYVFTDHTQNEADNSVNGRCKSTDINQNSDVDLSKYDDLNIRSKSASYLDKLQSSGKSVTRFTDLEKHVTFRKKLHSEESIDYSSHDDNDKNNTYQHDSDMNHVCDIHGQNVNSARRGQSVAKARKTAPTRTPAPAGKLQEKYRKSNDTNSDPRLRRSSYQESLV